MTKFIMTIFEKKKTAANLIVRYLNIYVDPKNIELLKHNEDGSYLHFAVNGSPVSYLYKITPFNTFTMYPNREGTEGMTLELVDE